MAVPFQRGFNDVFHVYAATANAALSAQRAQDAHCSHARFEVPWDAVERTGNAAGTQIWTDPGGEYDFTQLRSQLAGHGPIKSHPIVVGCPTSWIPRSERNPCRGVYPANPADDWTVRWYPRTAWAWQQYANFCVTTLKYLDNSCYLVDNVEVWNEPNAQNSDTMIPLVSSFSGMLGSTIATVNAANAAGTNFTHPMGVISGGLLMDYSQGLWKTYLNLFKNQAAPFGVGIHPYDTRNHLNESSNAAADAVAARIEDLYTQATNQCTNDLWVTETGCSAASPPWGPWGVGGQSRALTTLVGQGAYFAGRARCKGVFIHRMYPNDEGGSEAPGTNFFAYSTLNRYSWTPRTAHTMLSFNW